MTLLVTALASFAAGVLSSVSPCVVAAVPIAVGFVGGQARTRGQAVRLSSAFVIGMTASFVILGLAAARAGMFFGAIDGIWVAIVGIFVSCVGLWFWFDEPNECQTLPAANWRSRLAGTGALGAFAIGALTGAVMTPCATPALAAALVLAGSGSITESSAWQGAMLLGAYGLGHGLLLFLAGVAPGLAQSVVTTLGGAEYRRVLQKLFSGVLILAGIWMVTSSL